MKKSEKVRCPRGASIKLMCFGSSKVIILLNNQLKIEQTSGFFVRFFPKNQPRAAQFDPPGPWV